MLERGLEKDFGERKRHPRDRRDPGGVRFMHVEVGRSDDDLAPVLPIDHALHHNPGVARRSTLCQRDPRLVDRHSLGDEDSHHAQHARTNLNALFAQRQLGHFTRVCAVGSCKPGVGSSQGDLGVPSKGPDHVPFDVSVGDDEGTSLELDPCCGQVDV
eukprot:3238884-Rhodomonas_salina.2